MKNIRKYMMAAACMTAAAALVACTEAVKRDTEEEIQEMTVPKKPGPITKVPATLTCNGGEEFTFSVSKVQWAETYEWTIAEQEKSKISIIDGQGTNVITVRVVNDDVVIPAQSVSVVAKNELGASKVREYFAAITVSVPIELPGYTIKKYGKRWWMTENCHEAGEDGNLGVAPDLTAFSVAGLEASHLQRLNDAKGRYYTWYEAMTGISGCTAEQCPYVQNYEGVDDVGNAFKLDGTEEGEFGVQIRGCCPEGWHVANANDWWDMLMAIKSEYAIPDDFAQGGYTFSGGHDGKPENAITKAGFYKSGCTVKNTGNVGAWLRGGNGCGKSSVLKLISGENIPHTGEIWRAGGLKISYIPQDSSFLRGDLRSFARERGIDESRFKTILRKLDMTRGHFDRDMAGFSAGQRKKVLIAASLCEQAHVYVWDEPLNYIDLLSRMQIEELLLNTESTMIFVEHDRAFCDHVATDSIYM